MQKKDEDLSPYGLSLKKTYGRLVALLDEFTGIRRSRKDAQAKPSQHAS